MHFPDHLRPATTAEIESEKMLQYRHNAFSDLEIIGYMWRKSSKPVACRFLDIELEAQIGERGFRVWNA